MLLTIEDALADQALIELLVKYRRIFHKHPELGHEEWATSEFIEAELRQLNGLYVWRPASTSVAALLSPVGATQPAVIFRADIDALPIHEETGRHYSSERPGIMHGCGHDGHAAALVATARLLSQSVDQLRRPIMFVFQQAEEKHPSGAPMVLDSIKTALGLRMTDATVFGFHLWPELPEGIVGLRAGTLMGSVVGVTIRLTRRESPSLERFQGADALWAAADLHLSLRPLLKGRRLTDESRASLLLGSLNAGVTPQEPAAEALLRGTLRATTDEDEAEAVAMIRMLADRVADRYLLRCETTIETGIRPVVLNEIGAVQRLRDACDLSGLTKLDYPDDPMGVSEDFGWYLKIWHGAYFLVGCGSDSAHHHLHSPEFDFREEVLVTPVVVMTTLARS